MGQSILTNFKQCLVHNCTQPIRKNLNVTFEYEKKQFENETRKPFENETCVRVSLNPHRINMTALWAFKATPLLFVRIF